MSFKAGVFIGQALIDNPHTHLSRLMMKDVNIEEDGLTRIVTALNTNRNIRRVHVGVISNVGLNILARTLADNKTLTRLEF